ncbi:HD-GYP domain-containing protein [Zavarzinella formosa]|uniref:HD-GYP domain-containing protein n=1 Tax=Zavarzinella formosa TaxID=360055 RepID=UPI0012FC565A|nr:HD domain-containing phosphohydrolase [Zavarzinella formosa]
MTDTRTLLNRIAEFRKRIEAMPRLIAPDAPTPVPDTIRNPLAEALPQKVKAGSRNQAILEQSLRQLAGTEEQIAAPTQLCSRARRLLMESQGLVTRLRAIADDPLLAGPPADDEGQARDGDPLVVHYRETAAMTEAAVRYTLSFPDTATDQMRLCEGLETMLEAAQRRFGLLVSALESHRGDVTRTDKLARFLAALDHTDTPIDPEPLYEITHALMTHDAGRPMRFLYSAPNVSQAYLGGPSLPAPARFIAAHAMNSAKIAVRILRNDTEWRGRMHEVVLAVMLQDIGMLRVDPAVLLQAKPLTTEQRRYLEAHSRYGAEVVMNRLPMLGGLVEAIAAHHERADGTGYPMGLRHAQVSPLGRLVSVIDVYAAFNAPRPHRPAFDPRAALTEVMLLADSGKLDRQSAEKLLVLGFYPTGTVVELTDGSTGVVLNTRDPRQALSLANKPMMSLLADEGGHAYPTPRFLDLAETEDLTVVRALTRHERINRLGRPYPEYV